MGEGPSGDAFYKAGSVAAAGEDTRRPSSDELALGRSSGLPVSPITINNEDVMGARGEDRSGDQEMTRQGAQVSVDGVPGAAQAGEGRTPRRRGRETPDQEMARALGDEVPRIGIREEAIPSVGVRRSVTPSRAEREEHDRTHIPYRDWCECCVRGRGQEDAHRQSSNVGEYQVPQFGADY